MRRPMRDQPTMPMVRPRLLRSPRLRRSEGPAVAPRAGLGGEERCAFLPARMIAASVYSATGRAFSSAAEVTTIPRAHASSGTRPRTVPAACRMARRRGAAASCAGVIGGAPHDVTMTSASASCARACGLVQVVEPQRLSHHGELAQPVDLLRVELELERALAHEQQDVGPRGCGGAGVRHASSFLIEVASGSMSSLIGSTREHGVKRT